MDFQFALVLNSLYHPLWLRAGVLGAVVLRDGAAESGGSESAPSHDAHPADVGSYMELLGATPGVASATTDGSLEASSHFSELQPCADWAQGEERATSDAAKEDGAGEKGTSISSSEAALGDGAAGAATVDSAAEEEPSESSSDMV